MVFREQRDQGTVGLQPQTEGRLKGSQGGKAKRLPGAVRRTSPGLCSAAAAFCTRPSCVAPAPHILASVSSPVKVMRGGLDVKPLWL